MSKTQADQPHWVTLSRNRPPDTDGWADETFLLKYRVLSANEQSGNHIVSLFMGFSAPTGSATKTMNHATFTPTIAFGKGRGDFDVQGAVGASIPDNAPGLSGHRSWRTSRFSTISSVSSGRRWKRSIRPGPTGIASE